MKLKLIALLSFVLMFTTINGQTKKNSAKKSATHYPETFTISKTDFDKLFTCKVNETIKSPNNKYLDKSVLLLHTNNGNMQLLRIKLNYFAKATLMVQVSGEQSTQVFITSSDKSLSYKGHVGKDQVSLTRCKEEEIVSE